MNKLICAILSILSLYSYAVDIEELPEEIRDLFEVVDDKLKPIDLDQVIITSKENSQPTIKEVNNSSVKYTPGNSSKYVEVNISIPRSDSKLVSTIINSIYQSIKSNLSELNISSQVIIEVGSKLDKVNIGISIAKVSSTISKLISEGKISEVNNQLGFNIAHAGNYNTESELNKLAVNYITSSLNSKLQEVIAAYQSIQSSNYINNNIIKTQNYASESLINDIMINVIINELNNQLSRVAAVESKYIELKELNKLTVAPEVIAQLIDKIDQVKLVSYVNQVKSNLNKLINEAKINGQNELIINNINVLDIKSESELTEFINKTVVNNISSSISNIAADYNKMSEGTIIELTNVATDSYAESNSKVERIDISSISPTIVSHINDILIKARVDELNSKLNTDISLAKYNSVDNYLKSILLDTSNISKAADSTKSIVRVANYREAKYIDKSKLVIDPFGSSWGSLMYNLYRAAMNPDISEDEKIRIINEYYNVYLKDIENKDRKLKVKFSN